MLLADSQRSEFRRLRDALIQYCHIENVLADGWLAPDVIDRFVAANPGHLSPAELDMVSHWRHAAPGPFFVMRHTPSCTIFMSPLGTFAVRGIDRELSELVPKTPTLVDVTLLPFGGLIVCATNPRFEQADLGEACRADIDATYRSLADKGVIYSAAAMTRALRGEGSPMRARAVIRRPCHEEVASDQVPTLAAADDNTGERDGARLAPVELLRPSRRRREQVVGVPAGLAQVIAFKPRDAARVAYS